MHSFVIYHLHIIEFFYVWEHMALHPCSASNLLAVWHLVGHVTFQHLSFFINKVEIMTPTPVRDSRAGAQSRFAKSSPGLQGRPPSDPGSLPAQPALPHTGSCVLFFPGSRKGMGTRRRTCTWTAAMSDTPPVSGFLRSSLCYRL